MAPSPSESDSGGQISPVTLGSPFVQGRNVKVWRRSRPHKGNRSEAGMEARYPGLMGSLVRVGRSSQDHLFPQEVRAGLQAGPCIRPLLAPPGLDTPHSGPRCQHSRARSQDSCLRKLLTLLFLGLHAVKRLAQAPGVLLSPSPFQRNPGGLQTGQMA